MKIRINSLQNLIAQTLILIGVVYCSGYAFSTSGNYTLNFLMAIVFLTGAIIFQNKSTESQNVRFPGKKWRFINANSLYFASITIGLLISLLFHGETWFSNFIEVGTILFIVIGAYIISNKVNAISLCSKYVNLMSFISAIALIIFFIPLLGDVLSIGSFINVNGVAYDNGVLWFRIIGSKSIIGVFWERGLFGSFVLLALSFYALKLVKFNLFRVTVLSLSAVLCSSTAVYILAVLIFIMVLDNYGSGRRSNSVLVVLLFGAVILAYIYQQEISRYLVQLNPDIFDKLVDETALTRNTRLLSPTINFAGFLEAPFAGNGIQGANSNYARIAASMGLIVDAQTSTSTFMLNALGIFGVLYTVIPVYCALRNKQMKIISRIALALLFLLIINKEPHFRIAFTYIFSMSLAKYYEQSIGTKD